MSELVEKIGIKREKGYLYFVDKKGNACSVPMARGRGKKSKRGKRKVIAKTKIKKEKGYLYFIDKKGNISRAEMAHGKKKKRKK